MQEYESEEILQQLCNLMELNEEKAALALQTHFERAIANDKELHRLGCLGKYNIQLIFVIEYDINIGLISQPKPELLCCLTFMFF